MTPTDPPAPRGLDSPVTAKIIKAMARVQTRIFKATGGRIGGRWRIGAGWRRPVPTLLLEHRGRRSGQMYTTPLLFLRDGEDLVVAGSQGGLPGHPQWYRNLLAEPAARVQVPGGTMTDVRAREAEGDERARLWAALVELYADFADYQQWTDRRIPVIVLSPASGGAATD